MISETGYNVKKIKFCRKIRSEVHHLLPLYINRLTTKKLPTKRILKTIDSSVKNFGEVKYENQKCLQHQKTQA